MPETTRPISPETSSIDWENGSGTGGIFTRKRVIKAEDKIIQSDINQIRDFIEHLHGHTHGYEDKASTSTSKT